MPNWHPWARAVEKELDRQAAEAYEAGTASVEEGQPPLDVGRMRSELMELRRALTLEKQRGEVLRAFVIRFNKWWEGADDITAKPVFDELVRIGDEAIRITKGNGE